MKTPVFLFCLLITPQILFSQKPDTSIAVNGWKVCSYSSEIISARAYLDGTNSYHGKYSQWFEVVRNIPDHSFFKQYYAMFRKKLSTRISKLDFLEIAINSAHTEPKVSTIVETPILEIAYGNHGQISTFQTIINTTNDGWTDIALSNKFTSLDSIDCLYFRISGSFLRTKIQADYLRLRKSNVGQVITPIEDFEDTLIVSAEKEINPLPDSYNLFQNYPNPFNPNTTIKYSIPVVETRHASSLLVSLKIYDILGREVATLVDEYKLPGNYEISFNAETLHATSLPSGIYFYTLQSGNFSSTKKMVLLK